MFQMVPEDVLPLVAQSDMPQIHEHDYPAMFVFLGTKGYTFSAGYIDASTIKMHQEVDIAVAMSYPAEQLAKPILLSADNIVLDGDHRGYRHAVDKTPAPFIRIGANWDEAIKALFEFPSTYERR